MSILEKAIAEKEYQKKNGTAEERNPVSEGKEYHKKWYAADG